MELNQKTGISKIFSLGLQHVLAMYAGAILVPIIVGNALKFSPEQQAFLISVDLLTCGLATLLQSWASKWFGIGLPVVMGTSFVAVSPMITIGTGYGIHAIYGAIIAAGLFIILFSKVYGKLLKLFPPVVTGTVVMIIGLSLIPTGINNMGGGQGSKDFGSPENLLLSFGVLALILIMNRFFKGFLRAISVLLGIIAGTIAATVMGKVDFTVVAEASWFRVPAPFYFGMPAFHIVPVITMIIVGTVILVESTGAFLALGEMTDRKLTGKDITNGYRAEGISFILGGIFNAFPYSTFSQNVGLVQLAGIKTKKITIAAGIILICLGVLPKIAALATIIPTAVFGGATVVMFGMVVSSGIRMLRNVDFSENSNLLIIACSVSLGLGATVVPDLFHVLPPMLRILVNDGIICGSLCAIILNLLLPKKDRVRAPSDIPVRVVDPALKEG
ncbi:nucleobase:cation symporter-2 family protein [Weizmannia coagulans]|nr:MULTISPECIES: nucleobase:cation symporter-2 family protein [Heyndrickxia]ATW83215.1 purine permease [Heyndrickxia coagulans]AWP37032.1 purine permease [Heyndrickxia coagulans]KGB28423.1 Uric acid permease PucJ [Heyndrickxia coagulans]KXT22190.1 Uric acid permease PucJ [Heyndrickxia coagulans]MBT2193868.1 purine permease [Heyndrickxia coagulans]